MDVSDPAPKQATEKTHKNPLIYFKMWRILGQTKQNPSSKTNHKIRFWAGKMKQEDKCSMEYWFLSTKWDHAG